VEVFEHLRKIEDTTKEEKEIIKIQSVVRLESSSIFLVDFEGDTLGIGVDCGRKITRRESFSFCL
jgi:hypothetical protein